MTVEDGTGLADADSYVSVDFADSYYSGRGYSDWSSLETEDREQLLVKATDFIDSVFDWYGKKASYEQALNFPRLNLIDPSGYTVEGVPLQVKHAVCEAVKILVSGSDLFRTLSENGAVVSEKIGELQFSYDRSVLVKDSTLYETVNSRLRGLYRDKSRLQVYFGRTERV